VENTDEAAQSICLSLMGRKPEVGFHLLHCDRAFESLPGLNAILLSRSARNNHVFPENSANHFFMQFA
jgi:hypothetical protein